MGMIRVQPDAVQGHADRYREVLARLEHARGDLLGIIDQCEVALGSHVQDTVRELRWSAAHALDVLGHDHRQVQAGLAAVADCYRQLDQALSVETFR
jgi:hypothetical protein